MADYSYDIRGSDIEVYWGPSETSIKSLLDESNWFTAKVLRTEERLPCKKVRVATIRYRAVPLLKFPSFHQEVFLLDTLHGYPALQCLLTGSYLRWRFAKALDCPEDHNVVRNETDDMDVDGFLPPGSQRANKGDSDVRVRTSLDLAAHNANVGGSAIETRVSYLEAAIMVQRETLSRLYSGVRHEVLASHDRPLMYLRMRLNNLLQRGPRDMNMKTNNEERGVFTDSIQCQADCSLAEFENLTLHVLSTSNDRICFLPPCKANDIPRLQEKVLGIQFTSLKDLLDTIGITSDTLTASAMFKIRKGRKVPIKSCRLVGQLLCSGRRAPDPFCICVGHVITEKLYKQSARTVPVLLREDTSWDPIDRRYKNELLLESVHKSFCRDLQSQHGLAMETSVLRKGKTRKLHRNPERQVQACQSFNLWWERFCVQNKHDIICGADSPQHVAGSLQVEIPTVNISNQSICKELVGLCTEKRMTELLS